MSGPIISVAILDIPTFETYLLWRKLIFRYKFNWLWLWTGYFCDVAWRGHMSVTLSQFCRFGKDADNFYLPPKRLFVRFHFNICDALTKSFGYTDADVLFVRPSATVLPRYQPRVPAILKTQSVKYIMPTVYPEFTLFWHGCWLAVSVRSRINHDVLFPWLSGIVERDLIAGVKERNPKVSWIWRENVFSSIPPQFCQAGSTAA